MEKRTKRADNVGVFVKKSFLAASGGLSRGRIYLFFEGTCMINYSIHWRHGISDSTSVARSLGKRAAHTAGGDGGIGPLGGSGGGGVHR